MFVCLYVCRLCVCVGGGGVGGGVTKQKKDGEKTAAWQQKNKQRTLVQPKHARVVTQRYVYFPEEMDGTKSLHRSVKLHGAIRNMACST